MMQITPELENKIKEWREIVRKAKESGVPKVQWCRENGIARNSLFYWQRRIEEYEALTQGSKQDEVPVFCEVDPAVVVAGGESLAPDDPLKAHAMIRVGKYQVYVDDSFSMDTLSRILAVIRDA